MATEKDFELLDNYLSNRMKGQEKLDFEKKMESDSSLREELGLQKEFIEGIRKARVAELKAMLNEIATPAPTNSSLLAKVGLTATAVAVVGLGLYFFFGSENTVTESTPITIEEPAIVQPSTEEVIANDKTQEVVPPQEEVKSTEKDQTAITDLKVDKQDESISAPLKQPSLEPYDPTKELEHSAEKPAVAEEFGTPISSSSLVVETDNTNRKLDFHYQFKDGKLILMGSFEKDLYEILEFFNNNKRTIFLYYNTGYYLLDEDKSEPTPLKAITDPALLQKLKAYRNK